MEMGPLRGFCKFRGVRAVTCLPALRTKRGLITYVALYLLCCPLIFFLVKYTLDVGMWQKACSWAQIVAVIHCSHPGSEQGCCCSTGSNLSLISYAYLTYGALTG